MIRPRSLAVIAVLLFLPLEINAQYQVVEIADVQSVKSLSGVVQDFAGSPMESVLVQELSPDWKAVLRTSRTDNHGRFSLAPLQGRKIYYLQLSASGFDPLRVRVQLDPKHGTNLKLTLVTAT
jgi:hypothetical protein